MKNEHPLITNASSDDSSGGVETISREKTRVREPKLFKVILLNDDYTTMDFVVSILESVFQKSPSEATRIMLEVHKTGAGVCGLYPKQIAEAKVAAVINRAQAEEHPLQCIMEES
ncbi:MAG: ATP-dependent Clp protease adapter ClpS [Bdellovibrionales bacterium]|nr:ATP-dependent Clp protease adapter ClpS [Bdellovibrionales bacterium]